MTPESTVVAFDRYVMTVSMSGVIHMHNCIRRQYSPHIPEYAPLCSVYTHGAIRTRKSTLVLVLAAYVTRRRKHGGCPARARNSCSGGCCITVYLTH